MTVDESERNAIGEVRIGGTTIREVRIIDTASGRRSRSRGSA